jgi:hypothetical protein
MISTGEKTFYLGLVLVIANVDFRKRETVDLNMICQLSSTSMISLMVTFRKEKVRNVTIREIMEVGKNILEVIEVKRLRWFGHVKRMPRNRLPQKMLEWEPEGTQRRGRPKERWIDGVRQTMD